MDIIEKKISKEKVSIDRGVLQKLNKILLLANNKEFSNYQALFEERVKCNFYSFLTYFFEGM